jgi:uncharacterized iron-regulated protein
VDFIDNIKNMVKKDQKQKVIPSIPIVMAKPLEGIKVRFWTKKSMQAKEAKTILDNSFVGKYNQGYFITETNSWSENEIFSWTKYKKHVS